MVPELDVSFTVPPWQKVVAPSADIDGVAGNGFTVTVVTTEAGDVQPEALVKVTL